MASIIRNSDGSPKYTNKLTQSASPYLLQHAHNPVEWYPWGPDALALAKRENKPIFLSIGYSTCYWCHVMEREIFADPAMASLMNQYFINIKVDREERPDLDEIYMAARQLLTGEGGWPNNVFLTPNLEPFFAGGTFSADARYGRMSFPELVQSIAQGWVHKREDVQGMANTVTTRMRDLLSPEEKGRPPVISYDRISYLISHWVRMHDKQHGGFYTAPKFPNETLLLFLMDVYRLRKDVEVLAVISRTLDNMAAGGIFDHVGGGFHRYAVDAEWKVPHFEKMLYNQALLGLVYAEAAELTGKSYYEYIARSTLDFVLNKMTSPEGAFYSAFDAENDAVEGAYYVWDELEIRKLLSEGASRIFFETFDLAEMPQFPGHKHPEGKVLYAKKPLDVAARERDLAYDEFQSQLDKIMGKLLLVRERREAPMLDTKIIASWNGMMIHTFAQVGMLLEEPRYVAAAERACEFILNKMTTRNFTVGRIYNTSVQIGGFLEDYAWVVAGLLSVYQATEQKRWLTRAIDIINRADDLFLDSASLRSGRGGFFYTSGGKDLIVKIKSADDSAIPSANAVMVHNLVTLEHITRGTEYEGTIWRERAVQTLAAFAEAMETGAESHTHLLHGWMLLNTNAEALKAIQPASGSANTGMAMTGKSLSSSHYVKVTARLADEKISPGGNFTVNVRLRIAKGWHVNANPSGRDLIATRITLEGDHLTMKKVQFPNPVTLDFANQSVNVYQDEVLIPVLCSLNQLASPGDIEAIQVKVDFQACSDTTCLAESHEIIELPLVVSSS